MIAILVPLLLVAGVTPVLFYLGRLYFAQEALIFRPGALMPRTPADCGLPFETIRLPLASGRESYAWWAPHAGARRSVIFFHGSDGNLSYELATIAFLYGLRANVLAVEYPGYAGNGDRVSEKGCYEAADAAWRFLTARLGDGARRTVLLGQSLGGAVAAYLAAQHECAGLVIHSGFTSIPELAESLVLPALSRHLPARWFVHTKMNTLAYASRCGCPVLLLHSKDDEHIGVAHAHRLYAAIGGAPKKLVLFGGRHRSRQWMQLAPVTSALRELLDGELGSWQST